jgi:hypothetical protein
MVGRGKCEKSRRVLFVCKADLGFFHFLEIVTGWLVPPLVRRSQCSLTNPLLKTGFFRQLRELKMQKKKPDSTLQVMYLT